MPSAKFYVATGSKGMASQDGVSWAEWAPDPYPHMPSGFTFAESIVSVPRQTGPDCGYFGGSEGNLYRDTSGLAEPPELLWTAPSGTTLAQLVVSQLDPLDLVVVAEPNHLYRSRDGGATWTLALDVTAQETSTTTTIGTPLAVSRVLQDPAGDWYGAIANPFDPAPFYAPLWVRFGPDFAGWALVLDPLQERDVMGVLRDDTHHQGFSGTLSAWDAGPSGTYAALGVTRYRPFTGGDLVTRDAPYTDTRDHQTPPYLARDFVDFWTEPHPGAVTDPANGASIEPDRLDYGVTILGGIPLTYPSGAELEPHRYGIVLQTSVNGTVRDTKTVLETEPLDPDPRVFSVPTPVPVEGDLIVFASVPWQGGMTEGFGFGFTAEESVETRWRVSWEYQSGVETAPQLVRDSGGAEVVDPTFDPLDPAAPHVRLFVVFSGSERMVGISDSGGGSGPDRYWTWGAALSELPAPAWAAPLDAETPHLSQLAEDPFAPGTVYGVVFSDSTVGVAVTADDFETLAAIAPEPADLFTETNDLRQFGVGLGVPPGVLAVQVQLG